MKMIKGIIYGALIAGIVLFFHTVVIAQGSNSALSKMPDYVPGELLVKFRPGISKADENLLHSQIGATVIREFKPIAVQHVRLQEGIRVDAALNAYASNPDVVFAEPNYIYHAVDTFPDDPYFSVLWGLHNTGQVVNGTPGTADIDIDAPNAWDTITGGSEVIIGVIDTGVDWHHPELSDNIWINETESNGTPGLDDDGNGYIDDIRGWDFYGDDNNPMDYNGHGTHVSGTIAGIGNNGATICGVMWTAKIMSLRFLDATGSGDSAKAVWAIIYASENGAKVLNNSWGGFGFSQTLQDAITFADSKGVVFVAAAGNYLNDNDVTPFYPASYDNPNIISVAAVDQDGNLASFSSYGANTVDIGAPGTNIMSSIPPRGETVFYDNMESGTGWIWGGTSDWAWTMEAYGSPIHSYTDSEGGPYGDNANTWLQKESLIDLSGREGCVLRHYMIMDVQGLLDGLWIEGSTNGVIWPYIGWGRWSGITTGSYFDYDITAYDGQQMYLRFRLESNDDGITGDGVHIDDVQVLAASSDYSGVTYPLYSIGNGTSMASPHVAGVAGLVFAQRPGATAAEVKGRLMDTVKTLVSLNGITVTGGMVNAGNAVYESGDELAVDFGTNGLWHYDGTEWTNLAGWNPDGNMESWTGGLAVDFGAPYGLWNYDGSSWSSLAGWNPGDIEAYGTGLAADFDTYGLWYYNGSTWTSLAGWNPDGNMVEWTGGLAVDFGSSYGLWNYDGSSWSSLAAWNPADMEAYGTGLAVDFDSYGLWNYNGTGWMSLAGWNPDGNMEVWTGGLAVDFGAPYGLWNYDGSTWTSLAGWDPDVVEAYGTGLSVDFSTYGVWYYDGSIWTSLAGWNPEDMEAWANSLAVDFGVSYGLWNYNGSSWSSLAGWDPEDMIDISLF